VPARKHAQRYREIVTVLIDEGLDNALDVTGLRAFAPIRGRFTLDKAEPIPVRVRHTVERLGPTFIKLGQAASTRPDVIPEDVCDELAKLQDHVAPIPFDEARAVVEQELGAPLDDVFESFDREPIASASIGQVYAATLPDGTDVVVKAQRPGVDQIVKTDLDILMTQARFAQDHSDLSDYYDIPAIAGEFADAVREELDYIVEGRNADRLRGLFEDDDTVVFPLVYWDFTTTRVLTMERVHGIPFNRVDLLDEAHADRKELAQRGIFCYLEQIFTYGFFHADPHPGNLFALPDGRVAFTDFGRVGTISQVGRDQLADLFMGIIDNDTSLVVDTLLDGANSRGDIDVAALEREVSHLIAKYYNKSLREVHAGELISEVMQLVQNHHLAMSSELAVLLATLVVLEGLGTKLDPTFDFVEATTPFARAIAAKRFEPPEVARSFTRSLRRTGRLMTELPESLTRLMKRAAQGEFRVALKPTGFEPILARFEEATNRLAFALVVSAFVIGLSMILTQSEIPIGFMWVARVAWAAALVVGSWFFISILWVRFRRK
jgi:ubiquinone biosynthesis protein